MVLADSHVKALLKEGAMRAGAPPSSAEWRFSPESIAAAKERAEQYLRRLGETAAKNAGVRKQSTLKGEDVTEPMA